MLADYTGVLVILAVGFILVGAMLGVHLLLGPRRRFESKLEPFECGEQQIVSPRQRYAVKFYMVAILFVVFDVEAIFFYPVGLVYEWMKGGLEW
jgi:NADH-quinone oxidoreductase subunit A